METIAVYWEDRIKTYGFSEVTGLTLVQWGTPLERLSALGSGIHDMGRSGMGMLLVLGQRLEGNLMEFALLVEKRWEDQAIRRLGDITGGTSPENVSSVSPAGLIHFYGPHFGDRYGIADAALKALMESSIPILAISCSASSIYIVLSEHWMEKAREALSKAFLRPER